MRYHEPLRLSDSRICGGALPTTAHADASSQDPVDIVAISSTESEKLIPERTHIGKACLAPTISPTRAAAPIGQALILFAAPGRSGGRFDTR